MNITKLAFKRDDKSVAQYLQELELNIQTPNN